MGKDRAKHGIAAFAPEDVEDARRGEPAGTLERYATERGLTYCGQQLFGAFRGVFPDFEEYVFNAVRGALPGGGVGMLQHELQEISVESSRGIAWPGEFHHARYATKAPKGFWNNVLPVDIFSKPAPAGPFTNAAVWVPVTAGAVRVPEAALFPRVLVRRADRFRLTDPSLERYGLPGFRMRENSLPPDTLAAIFSGEAERALSAFAHPHVELLLSHGSVAVRRNGFVLDDAGLDEVAETVSRVAHGLADAAAPLRRPQPFATDLPSVATAPPADVSWYRYPDADRAEAYASAALDLGMVQEDPVEFHRAFPHQPVPGLAGGVLRGELPGWDGRPGRLVFTTHGRGAEHQVRGAVLFAAPADAPTFEPGGSHVTDTDAYVEVVDGIAAIWNRARTVGLEAQATLDRALRTARQVGLV